MVLGIVGLIVSAAAIAVNIYALHLQRELRCARRHLGADA